MRVVFCSCPRQDAKRIAREIIEKRLAACIQILPAIESVYHWKGEICEDEEALLLIKTDASILDALTAQIVALHPYTVPEVIAVPIMPEEGHEGYRMWLLDEIRKGQKEVAG
jgi:periplasmic divalent cation tolerance protein